MAREARQSTASVRSKSPDLHGNAPDNAEVALLLVDVINDLEFDSGVRLLRSALPAARALRALKSRAKLARIPCIYANDNFGRWRSDFTAQVRHCLEDGTRGAPIAELLVPEQDDYFVLKPKHSAFYQTCLSILLEHLQVHTLVLAGFTSDSCLTFTAADAYLRNYQLIVPHDTSAAASKADHRAALKQMRGTLHAQTPSSRALTFLKPGGVRVKEER